MEMLLEVLAEPVNALSALIRGIVDSLATLASELSELLLEAIQHMPATSDTFLAD